MRKTASRRRPQRRPRPRRAVKISITVDAAVLRDARKAARRSGLNLSAQVTEALARDVRRRRLAELIAQYEAEAGVITERELAEARGKWRA